MKSKINLILPATDDRHLQILFFLNDFILKHPDLLLYPMTRVYAIYGCPAGAIWNGGRTIGQPYPRLNISQIKSRFNFLNNNNIRIYLTFSNSLLTYEHLKDEYCNNILKIANESPIGNGVIVTSDILKTYIQENYPNLKLISSITSGNSIDNFEKKIQQDYDQIVAYPKKKILLDIMSMDEKEKERIEILMTTACANCPNDIYHYMTDSKNNLEQNLDRPFPCPHIKKVAINDDNTICSFEECLKAGVTKFKFAGRGDPAKVNLQYFINFITKPEYQNFVFNEIYNNYLFSESVFDK